MILLSCVNCCHNPLQTDSIGTSVGFCTEHRRVLISPAELTCGRHLRKDLTAPRAIEQRERHQVRYTPSAVVKLDEPRRAANGGYTSNEPSDIRHLEDDHVGVAVLDYGKLDSKIASLAQLRPLEGARPEVARLSLARAYVNRCIDRGGKWTSGVHLLWWTRRSLLNMPEVGVNDIRGDLAMPLARQVELAEWSLIMLRILFISDVGYYAPHTDPVHHLATFAENAAATTGVLSPKKLLAWLKRDGQKIFDKVLPERRYEALASELRNQHPD